MKECREKGRKEENVRTILNRRRLLPQINSQNYSQKRRSERQAINSVIQGSASDVIKLSMIKIDKEISKLNDRLKLSAKNSIVKLIMNVHDELVYQIEGENYLEEVEEIIRVGMESSFSLLIPLVVELFFYFIFFYYLLF